MTISSMSSSLVITESVADLNVVYPQAFTFRMKQEAMKNIATTVDAFKILQLQQLIARTCINNWHYYVSFDKSFGNNFKNNG